MKSRSRSWAIPLGAALAIALASVLAGTAVAAHRGRRVLLISVDGLHANDLAMWVSEHPQSALARLARRGTTYTDASTSTPSDSFPGLLAEVTGGSPTSTGVFYDNAYDRTLYPPGSNCTGPAGADAVYDESVDQLDANGKIPFTAQIDPAKLPLQKTATGCEPLFPHSYLKVNTIFEVARAAGLRTAWADKHPVYDLVNGPSGHGVVDLFTPEINTEVTPASFPRPDLAITDWVPNTEAYDQIKVDAILNEIAGKDSSGTQRVGVPALFGMNFQTVSVAEKLVDPVASCVRNPAPATPACDPAYVPGGYQVLGGKLTFTPQLEGALGFVDLALGTIVHRLVERGLDESTTIIVTAKHGQSPQDPGQLAEVSPDALNAAIDSASGAAAPSTNIAHATADDTALIWLKDRTRADAVAAALVGSGAGSLNVQSVLSGAALHARFGDDERTPDVIVQPIQGTIYTGSKAKVAEHGGGAHADLNVALLVAGGDDEGGATISTPVQTTQIAPTVLRALHLDPQQLQAVQAEGTTVLPTPDDDD
jgi:hypothetical protein